MFRLFYAIEFLIALVATFTVWSQVGGQYHLDLMAWYWKLCLGVGIAVASVKATAAAVKGQRPGIPARCAGSPSFLALAIACGVITYYYHLNEPPDDEDQQDSDAPAAQTAL